MTTLWVMNHKKIAFNTIPPTSSKPTSLWEMQKARLKAKFTQLNDLDLEFQEGRKNEMLTRLQIKTRRTVRELESIMANRS